MRLSVKAFCLALLLIAAPAIWADSVIKINIHTDAIEAMGVAESDEVNTLWLGGNKLRDDRSGQSVIVNMDDKKLYVVRHDAKVYHALDLPLDLKSLVSPEEAAQFEMMAQQMEMKVQITPTDQVKEVAGFNAKLYKIDLSNPMGMAMELDVWMSDEVGVDAAAFKKLYLEMLSAQPMGAEWIKEIMAIEGFRVQQDTKVKMMGTEFGVREELVSIEEMDAPAGTYTPPSDYKLEPFDFNAMAGGPGGP